MKPQQSSTARVEHPCNSFSVGAYDTAAPIHWGVYLVTALWDLHCSRFDNIRANNCSLAQVMQPCRIWSRMQDRTSVLGLFCAPRGSARGPLVLSHVSAHIEKYRLG